MTTQTKNNQKIELSEYNAKLIKLTVDLVIEAEASGALAELFHGDPFDKLIRNISMRNHKGQSFYNNTRSFGHYPRSETADTIITENIDNKDSEITTWTDLKEAGKQLYFEHDTPIKVLKTDIETLLLKKPSTQEETNQQKEEVKDLITKGCDVTLVTKAEAEKIDTKYKSSMPMNGLDRYEAMNIKRIYE